MKNKKKTNNYEQTTLAILGFIVVITIVIIGMYWFTKRINKELLLGDTDQKEYKYHYMMIGASLQDDFWKDAYRGAKSAGEKHNIYVEDLAQNLEQKYNTVEMIEIAIAAKVDGIIVEGNSSEAIKQAIDKASEANIPVITIGEDAPQSKRKCFVGINGYQLGEVYGNQILNLKNADKLDVTVLMSEEKENKVPNLTYSGIKEVVTKENIEISTVLIDRNDVFSSEETIRALVLKKDMAPDVLVCLNVVDTQCAYQAVVDANKVGEIDIIGYYISDEIIDAIEKRIIRSSVTVDTKRMGEKAVTSLFEYKTTKHISEYEAVDAKVISSENVGDYTTNEE